MATQVTARRGGVGRLRRVKIAHAALLFLLAARSITYSNPAHGGPIGIHFAKVLERLGIASEMKARTVAAAAVIKAKGMDVQ